MTQRIVLVLLWIACPMSVVCADEVTFRHDVMAVLSRAGCNLVGSFGRVGHQLGEFYNLHFIGIDSKGNVYTGEVQGKRVQKFRQKNSPSKN